MKFDKTLTWLVALVTVFTVFIPTQAQADTDQTVLALTYKSGLNTGKSAGNLYLFHPDSVVCTGSPGTSNACKYQVSAKLDYTAVLPLYVNVINGNGGILSQFTISSANSLVNVSVPANSNMPVYYYLSSSNASVNCTQTYVKATNLLVSAISPNFQLNNAWNESVDSSSSRTFSVYSKFVFAQINFPTEMHTDSKCITVPVFAGAVDYRTGNSASPILRKDIDLEVYMSDDLGNNTPVSYLSEAKSSWSPSGTTTSLSFQVCNIDPSLGIDTSISLNAKATIRVGNVSYWANSSDQITVSGKAPLKMLACSKGSKAIIVKSAFPSCPSGYSNANIPIVNGKLKVSTITCVKGLTIRKVSAVIPSCPAGYRRR